MKMKFIKRRRGEVGLIDKVCAYCDNFIYHLRNGKSIRQAWDLAGKTF